MPARKAVGALAVEIAQKPCVVLGTGRKTILVAIPSFVECGIVCAAINATGTWLNKVVGEKGRADSQVVIKEFVDGLVEKMQRDAVSEGQAASSVGEEGRGESSVVKSQCGRGAMGLDEDSDEEVLKVVSCGRQGGSSAKRQRTTGPRSVWKTVKYREMELVVKLREKGRGIVVPVDGPTLPDMVSNMRTMVQAGEQPIPDLGKQKRRQEALKARDPTDGGRLRWDSAKTTYIIKYINEQGAMRTTSKTLGVPRVNAFSAAKFVALNKARALWNARDCSGAPRFKVGSK